MRQETGDGRSFGEEDAMCMGIKSEKAETRQNQNNQKNRIWTRAFYHLRADLCYNYPSNGEAESFGRQIETDYSND